MPQVTELVRVEPGIRCEPPCPSTHTLSTAPRGVEVFFPAYPPGFANQDLSSSLYMCTCVSSLASSSVCVCVCVCSLDPPHLPATTICHHRLRSVWLVNSPVARHMSPPSPHCALSTESGPKLSPAISLPVLRPLWGFQQLRVRISRAGAGCSQWPFSFLL